VNPRFRKAAKRAIRNYRMVTDLRDGRYWRQAGPRRDYARRAQADHLGVMGSLNLVHDGIQEIDPFTPSMMTTLPLLMRAGSPPRRA
jgi:hypothetical protein